MRRQGGRGSDLAAFAAPDNSVWKLADLWHDKRNQTEGKPVAPGKRKTLRQLITMGFTKLEGMMRRAQLMASARINIESYKENQSPFCFYRKLEFGFHLLKVWIY